MDTQIQTFISRFINTSSSRIAYHGIEDTDMLRMLKSEAARLLENGGPESEAIALREYILSYRREAHATRTSNKRNLNVVNVNQIELNPFPTASSHLITEMIDNAVQRFATAKQKKCFFAVRGGMGQAQYGRTRRPPISRARVTKLIQAATDWGLAGALVIACEEKTPEATLAILSPGFELYRPLCQNVISKFEMICAFPNKYKVDIEKIKTGFMVLWQQSISLLLDTARGSIKSQELLLTTPVASLILLIAGRWKGWLTSQIVHDLQRESESLSSHSMVERIFALMLSYGNADDKLIKFLGSSKMKDVEIASVNLFVNRNRKWTDSLLRDGDVSKVVDKMNANPQQGIADLAPASIAIMGEPGRQLSPGLSLMVMTWIERALMYFKQDQSPESAAMMLRACESLERYKYKWSRDQPATQFGESLHDEIMKELQIRK
ncbi:hypothetical protein [Gimesia aquarii]|nr:hypothetical protein [Gimesia aquarii]